MSAELAAVRRFEERYAARSGVTVEWLHEHGRWGAPCDCGEDGCEGFEMLYAPEDELDRERLEAAGLLQYVGSWHFRGNSGAPG